jgi:hypothetical protein
LAAKIVLVPQRFHRLELHKAKENMTKNTSVITKAKE